MSEYKDKGGNAFPHSTGTHVYQGMNLRDYFAAQALPQMMILVDQRAPDISADIYQQAVTMGAYEIADAMIKERNK